MNKEYKKYVDKEIKQLTDDIYLIWKVSFVTFIITLLAFFWVYHYIYHSCPYGMHKEWECLEELNYGGVCTEYLACLGEDGIVYPHKSQCNSNKMIKVVHCDESKQECFKGRNICMRDNYE